MKERLENIVSEKDGLKIELCIVEPEKDIKGVVQISHGMAEHKERYKDFMSFLANNGYVAVIHDHRGHGKSVKSINDLGYFYTEDINYIVDDLYQVTEYIKGMYPGLNIYLFSHSMGTLVSRAFIQKYDNAIKKLILCGPPTENKHVSLGLKLAKIEKFFRGDRKQSNFLNKLTFKKYNKDYKVENEWLCSEFDVVRKYNSDPLCGFIFKTNGFINLYKLMEKAYSKGSYAVKNKELNIYIIAGEYDPVIQSEAKLLELREFLKSVGYSSISVKTYPLRRHELINEVNKFEVYDDILKFIEG